MPSGSSRGGPKRKSPTHGSPPESDELFALSSCLPTLREVQEGPASVSKCCRLRGRSLRPTWPEALWPVSEKKRILGQSALKAPVVGQVDNTRTVWVAVPKAESRPLSSRSRRGRLPCRSPHERWVSASPGADLRLVPPEAKGDADAQPPHERAKTGPTAPEPRRRSRPDSRSRCPAPRTNPAAPRGRTSRGRYSDKNR